MAGKVFFSVSMSLDGFIAPESLEDLMGQQWMELQQWIFPQRFFREYLKLGEGGEEIATVGPFIRSGYDDAQSPKTGARRCVCRPDRGRLASDGRDRGRLIPGRDAL